MQAKYTTIQLLLDRLGANHLFMIKQDFFLNMMRSVKCVIMLSTEFPVILTGSL